MKYKRHSLILELIQKENIETQEELSERLKEKGLDVTQATISRDIKELRLIKILNDKGTYKYALTANEVNENANASRLYSIIKEGITKINYAGNMIVIKCYAGMAQAACAAIDSLQINGVVGTLAGEDTIFIVAVSEAVALEIVSSLNKMIK